MNTTRRHFLISSAGLVSTLALSRRAVAADHVDEDSPLAKQMHYTHDASGLDASSEPKFQKGDACANCQLFQGKAGDDWGPCPIFSGKDVSAKGWCTAYTKKS